MNIYYYIIIIPLGFHFGVVRRIPTTALVTSHSLLTPPPHTPHNYLPNLSPSVEIDLDKLKVPASLSSLCYFRVGGTPSGPHLDMLYEVLILFATFSLKVKFVYR